MYDPLDLSQTSPALFFTRWITHYCAPVFVFLAGTSAFIVGARKGKKELSRFLLTRGVWLIFLEISVVTFGWHFDIHFHEIDLQTIWALGFSMVVLSLLIWLPKRMILLISVLFIAGHNLLDTYHVPGKGINAILWAMVNDSNFISYPSFTLAVAYPVLAWIGVMAAGYCAGELYVTYSAEKRKRILLILGIGAIVLFIILRFSNVYGDFSNWRKQKSVLYTFMSFLNVTKYPPSLLYILMTIGPALMFLSIAEKFTTSRKNTITIYGRVPMFYYLVHIYLIHLAAMVAAQLTGYSWSVMITPMWITGNPALRGYGFSLPVVYLIWVLVLIILFPLCRWYDQYKSGHRQYWWLSYL